MRLHNNRKNKWHKSRPSHNITFLRSSEIEPSPWSPVIDSCLEFSVIGTSPEPSATEFSRGSLVIGLDLGSSPGSFWQFSMIGSSLGASLQSSVIEFTFQRIFSGKDLSKVFITASYDSLLASYVLIFRYISKKSISSREYKVSFPGLNSPFLCEIIYWIKLIMAIK